MAFRSECNPPPVHLEPRWTRQQSPSAVWVPCVVGATRPFVTHPFACGRSTCCAPNTKGTSRRRLSTARFTSNSRGATPAPPPPGVLFRVNVAEQSISSDHLPCAVLCYPQRGGGDGGLQGDKVCLHCGPWPVRGRQQCGIDDEHVALATVVVSDISGQALGCSQRNWGEYASVAGKSGCKLFNVK